MTEIGPRFTIVWIRFEDPFAIGPGPLVVLGIVKEPIIVAVPLIFGIEADRIAPAQRLPCGFDVPLTGTDDSPQIRMG